MNNSLLPPTNDAAIIVNLYGNMLYRICYVMLSNEMEAEDAVQETIIKYLQKAPTFKNAEHEKAWLILTAKNKCKDILRFRKRNLQLKDEHLQTIPTKTTDTSILELLMSLPEKFKIVLILYYVEEYPIKDIAHIIKRTPSAVKMRLKKGRKLLEEKYRKEHL